MGEGRGCENYDRDRSTEVGQDVSSTEQSGEKREYKLEDYLRLASLLINLGADSPEEAEAILSRMREEKNVLPIELYRWTPGDSFDRRLVLLGGSDLGPVAHVDHQTNHPTLIGNESAGTDRVKDNGSQWLRVDPDRVMHPIVVEQIAIDRPDMHLTFDQAHRMGVNPYEEGAKAWGNYFLGSGNLLRLSANDSSKPRGEVSVMGYEKGHGSTEEKVAHALMSHNIDIDELKRKLEPQLKEIRETYKSK